MSDDIIENLQAELAGLKGPARLMPLTRLGQASAERHWRLGPATPTGLPDLNTAIAAMEEAYGYMRDDDGLRGNLAGQLGWLLTARYSLHTEDVRDRDRAFPMLEEALAAANVPAVLRTMCRIQLGQLSLSQAMAGFQSPGTIMGLVNGNAPPGAAAHADRAVSCFREVLADPSTTSDMTEAIEPALTVAETIQLMVSGTGAAGLDMDRVMDAMAKAQTLRERFMRGATPEAGFTGTRSFFSFADFQNLMKLNPLDRPVTAVRSVAPAPEGGTAPARSQAASAPADRDQLRHSLHVKLAGAEVTEPIWTSAAALLLPDAPMPAIDVVDEVVALAGMVVELAGDDDGAEAEDRFVLAVALYLRDRADEGGDHADRSAGAENLLAAVRKVPLDHPAAATMLRALGAFLEADRPLGGVLDIVADDFADRLDAAIAAGLADDAAVLATLHALRCLCRAAGVMAELARAPVPPDYPWHTALKAATSIGG